MLERLQVLLAPRYVDPVWVANGGMGVVYAAHDTTLDRQVAVKVLAPELATAVGAARFRREAKILARLSHPHIVPIYETREADGLFIFIMGFVDGETLAARLRSGPLPPESFRALADHVLSALARAHREGVVHRDVKPGNIFCTSDGAMLADFGIAHWADGDSAITRADDRPGTPDYMAPEQFAGGPVTVRADVYSIARVLYEAVSGRTWVLAAEPHSADWSGVPKRMIPALIQGLQPAPDARWADAGAFRDALLTPRRRHRALTLRVGATVVVLAALGAAVAFRSGMRGGLEDPVPAAPADFALLPFEEGDSVALGRRLAQYASLRLEWYPRWHMVPRVQSFAEWDSARALLSPARDEIRGSLATRDGTWTLTVSIHGDSSRRLKESFEVAGDPADEMAWAGAVADSLVARLFPQEFEEYRELAGGATLSEPAAVEYFAGNDAFRHDNLSAAAEHYEKALRIDPGFTQARWQLLLVRRWLRVDIEPALRELYGRYGEYLPPLHAAVTAAQLEPDLRRRIDSLVAITDRFPGRPLARFIAADELFHRGALVGIPLTRSLALLEARPRNDPSFDQTWDIYNAAWGHIRLGNRDGAERALARLQRHTAANSDLEGRHRERFLRLAFDLRFRPLLGRPQLWWLARSSDPGMLAALGQYVRLALAFDLPDAQLRLGDGLAEHGRSASERQKGVIARALALLMAGRFDEGLTVLDAAAARDSSAELQLQTAEWRVVPELFGLPRRPVPERDRALARLDSASRASTPQAARAAWVLATVARRDRDTAEIERHHHSVHRAASPGAARLDVLLHADATSPDSALTLTEVLFQSDSFAIRAGPFARTAFYLSRAEWQRRAGAVAAADSSLTWYENSDLGPGWLPGPPHEAEVDFVFGVPARLRRSELALARGDTTSACRHLPRVRELWRDADPAIAELLRATANVRCP